MTTDNWFAALTFLAVYVMCLLLLDGAHRARIAELKHVHREQVAGLRSYIRTLSRERLWLEAEVQRLGDKDRLRTEDLGLRAGNSPFDPFREPSGRGSESSVLSPQSRRLPPSEEYDEQ
jgi:hypothetical protein